MLFISLTRRQEMERKLFAAEEAFSRVGKRVKTLVDFSGVPKGTEGVVSRADRSGAEGYTLAIQWDMPGRSSPLTDWFTKSEYERYLAEI